MNTLRFSNHISWGAIGDKVYVFEEPCKNYFVLTGAKAEIWRMIATQSSEKQLELLYMNKLKEKEIKTALRDLLRYGLLVE